MLYPDGTHSVPEGKLKTGLASLKSGLKFALIRGGYQQQLRKAGAKFWDIELKRHGLLPATQDRDRVAYMDALVQLAEVHFGVQQLSALEHAPGEGYANA